MRLELELALRFLRRRRGPLLRGTALAAFAGIALATAALVITLALMHGYRGAIAGALQRGNAHLVAFAGAPLELEEAAAQSRRLEALAGVRRAGAVSYVTALLEDEREPSNPLPVVLKAVAEPPAYTGLSAWPDRPGLSPAVAGARLAETLALTPGAVLRLQLPPREGSLVVPRLGLRLEGIFHLAFAEFDERWLVVPLPAMLDALPGTGVTALELELDDPLAVDAVRPAVEQALPPTFIVSDWREMNAALFAALRWQTLSLFVVLALVVAVASFQVSSALVVLAIDKRRATGMLQAVGATPAAVRRILLLFGALLGGAGVVLGLVVGVTASLVLTAVRAVRFPEGLARVYMVDHIPFVVSPVHLLAVAATCAVLVVAASFWPAWRASRLDPVVALRAV